MPDVQSTNNRKPLAAFIGDVHWSSSMPLIRNDDDWIATQMDYFEQVLRMVGGPIGSPKLFIAGDLFDTWNVQPELLNAISDTYSTFYHDVTCIDILSIYGQHDMPWHNPDLMDKSAYGTLERLSVIESIEWCSFGDTHVFAFPYGTGLCSLNQKLEEEEVEAGELNIALIHKYVWCDGSTGHPGASVDYWFERIRSQLEGFDYAIFGDNHIPFSVKSESSEYPTIINCGTFMRRHANELGIHPRVWFIYEDGSYGFEELDTSKDKFAQIEADSMTELTGEYTGVIEFIQDLVDISDTLVNFKSILERFTDRQSRAAKQIIQNWIGRMK